MSEAATLTRPAARAACEVRILYTNWRGETAPRLIRLEADRLGRLDLAASLWFGATEWHPEPQWLFTAHDVEKGAMRDFAMSGLKAWGDAQVEAALLAAAAQNGALLAHAPPAQRMSLAGFVSALDIASLKADSRDDAEALRAAADLVQNYDVEIAAALAAGAGSWTAWSETEVDSDPSDPLCGHATVWRVGWWRRGAAHADIEEQMGGPDGERRARALAAALNGLHALPPADPAPSPVEGEVADPVRRERAACAYLAECHTGLWDNATAVAIAGAIRERGRDADDGVLVSPEAWAAVQPVWMLLRHGQALPDDLAERIQAADLRASAPPEVETLESIARWAEETFGPIRPERIVGRAGEEMDELRAEPERVDEAADVVICLARYPGLGAAINRKMKVNRGRRWRLMGDGTGYHIKDGSPADLPTSAPPEVRHG